MTPGTVVRVINMDKKNLVIAFLLGALLMQPARAWEGYGLEQGAQIIASAMIKSAKIIGLGASTAGTNGVVDQRKGMYGPSYWDFVKRIPE